MRIGCQSELSLQPQHLRDLAYLPQPMLSQPHWLYHIGTMLLQHTPTETLPISSYRVSHKGLELASHMAQHISNPQSLILREPAPTLMLLTTICKLRSISIELQGHSHHHYCPAVRSVDLESSQRISSLTSGDSLSISLTQRVGVSIAVSQNICAH